MSKTFNIYCDESCHIQNDHKKFMLLGSVSCAYNQVKRHTERINELKDKHKFNAEIKWINASPSKKQFYIDLIDYFFDTDLRFRAIIIDKTQINTDDYDAFYYKMYYQLLNHKKNSEYKYNVYFDIKDTLSAIKVQKLRDILNIKYGVFNNVQNIHSHESILMQLADLIMGAISYNLNVNKNNISLTKKSIIDKIAKHSKQELISSSTFNEKKLNLFFIDLK
ncbi:MAG TPA: DUF3800 domain-containing protein [Bacteroidales bacterium]|nr:MAG: RlfA protein [Bacteroidetes bacterium GWF2_33_38]OFY73911.1 MAG: RlfA protein [Bacteroidetes bacterium RIFOXYA12_FULL_33_9]OFY85651.1 MAG: RlfA protein [Bacteroidetes bacterium RIFOXYA2_FULL_33_7]HBF88049.1 DUF3800 domain-containing protein [Bacteroidales bacterium]